MLQSLDRCRITATAMEGEQRAAPDKEGRRRRTDDEEDGISSSRFPLLDVSASAYVVIGFMTVDGQRGRGRKRLSATDVTS
jgi:hypothetical protein